MAITTPTKNRGYVTPTPGSRRCNEGRTIFGGSPFTFIQLSDAGAATLTRWFRGERPGWDNPKQAALAQKLIDFGLCIEIPKGNRPKRLRSNIGITDNPTGSAGSGITGSGLTIVIPVCNDADGLNATFAALGPSSVPTIVVDDGSRHPVVGSQLANGAALLRNERPLGPSAARQKALQLVATPLVVFIDAGVRVSQRDLADLAQYLVLDSTVGAAPRIRSLPGGHLAARYDAYRSPLDMGKAAGLVGPDKMVPYVPTACLMLDVSAVASVGGFDPTLRYGEDVDLVWRLTSAGAIHYVASVEVHHPPRRSLGGLAWQRIGYGSSAAPLAKRFGDDVAPVRLTSTGYLIILIALTGRPFTAIALAVTNALRLARRLDAIPDAKLLALVVGIRGQWMGGLAFLTAVCRTWWPLAAAVAVVHPGQRRRITAVFGLGLARRLLSGPRKPNEAALDLAVGAVDDLSYGLGLWLGAIRHRTVRPLLPSRISQPPTQQRKAKYLPDDPTSLR